MPDVESEERRGFSLRAKEPFSSYSHLLGLLLAVPGLVVLLVRTDGDPWRVVGFSLFGAGLILVYAASTLYHWLDVSEKTEDRLRRFDHVAIFFLIAASYSPVCLVTLRGPWGWTLLGLVWAIGFAGAAMKMFLPHLPDRASAAIYLAMGWLAVIAAVPIVEALPAGGLAWLAAGGLSYTVGGLIYGLRWPDPFPEVFGHHEIFHVAVLGGSGAHFGFMLLYVAPLSI